MSSNNAISTLEKVTESIDAIQEQLLPFLDVLRKHTVQEQQSSADSSRSKSTSSSAAFVHSNDISRHSKAEAQAAVALALGSLRYMDAKLRGSNCSQDPNHPLRVDLDKIRKALVDLGQVDPRPEEEHTGSSK
jgi:hypothetical protein